MALLFCTLVSLAFVTLYSASSPIPSCQKLPTCCANEPLVIDRQCEGDETILDRMICTLALSASETNCWTGIHAQLFMMLGSKYCWNVTVCDKSPCRAATVFSYHHKDLSKILDKDLLQICPRVVEKFLPRPALQISTTNYHQTSQETSQGDNNPKNEWTLNDKLLLVIILVAACLACSLCVIIGLVVYILLSRRYRNKRKSGNKSAPSANKSSEKWRITQESNPLSISQQVDDAEEDETSSQPKDMNDDTSLNLDDCKSKASQHDGHNQTRLSPFISSLLDSPLLGVVQPRVSLEPGNENSSNSQRNVEVEIHPDSTETLIPVSSVSPTSAFTGFMKASESSERFKEALSFFKSKQLKSQQQRCMPMAPRPVSNQDSYAEETDSDSGPIAYVPQYKDDFQEETETDSGRLKEGKQAGSYNLMTNRGDSNLVSGLGAKPSGHRTTTSSRPPPSATHMTLKTLKIPPWINDETSGDPPDIKIPMNDDNANNANEDSRHDIDDPPMC